MRKNKSSILEAVHETAKGLHQAGVMDMVTLREFDRLCLPPVEPLEPQEIKHIRESSRVSQAVFARLSSRQNKIHLSIITTLLLKYFRKNEHKAGSRRLPINQEPIHRC